MATSLSVYVCFAIEGMYTCKTEIVFSKTSCLCLCCLEGIYTCKTGNFGNDTLCLCLC